MDQFLINTIYIGKPKLIPTEAKAIETSINKEPVEGKVYVTKHNLRGDAQADLVHHGGVDKAICVYPKVHYAYWEERLNMMLPYSSFGENLLVSGLREDNVYIGDIFELGEAIVQVSQPRMPCFKVGVKLKVKEMPQWMMDTGFTGFYLRVLQEGNIRANDAFKRVQRGTVSVSYINSIYYHDKENIEALKQLSGIPELADSWKKMINKRIKSGNKKE